ncbi:phd finger domain-containing protein [Purpureocillium lavendulum]|uniref:Phd finger domain-containing protein n=1 Tax=Purpureocillium lavendulum TaxID=1247861 RepID=A0AB34G255_9HYPO|nr:phd finger domain-containing protein [Purpureocillium lavendulum]
MGNSRTTSLAPTPPPVREIGRRRTETLIHYFPRRTMASPVGNTGSKPQAQSQAPEPRPSSATASQLWSHGRGGAGNMADARQSPKLRPSDLETPVLKKPVVTTGRGGTGNMAKNDDPYETRLRQDVEGVPRRFSSGAQHAGRGGAGNVFRDADDGADLARKASREQAVVDDGAAAPGRNSSPVTPGADSLAAKGKNWLFGKKA